MTNRIVYTSAIHVLQHLKGMHYVHVPGVVLQQLGGGFQHRVLCSINGFQSFQAGIVSLGNSEGYITVSNARLKKWELKLGDNVTVSLSKDDSQYGAEMSAELKELLNQNTEGMRRFDMLTAGRQRYIIHYVNSVKSSEKRLERALLLIGNLILLPEGNESFREMLGKDSKL